jgi:hypothetical protein
MCGDWQVPYAEIEDAVLISIPAWGGPGEQRRLIVRGRGKVYQFVLPRASVWSWKAAVDPFWDGPLPFPVRRVPGEIERRSILLTYFGMWALLGLGALVFALA